MPDEQIAPKKLELLIEGVSYIIVQHPDSVQPGRVGDAGMADLIVNGTNVGSFAYRELGVPALPFGPLPTR
jgi:hypothetical protein